MSIFVNEHKKNEPDGLNSSNSFTGTKIPTQKCDLKRMADKKSILNNMILERQTFVNYSTKNISNSLPCLNCISSSKNPLKNYQRPFFSTPDICKNRSSNLAHALPMTVSNNEEIGVNETVFSPCELEFKETIGEGFFGRVTKVVKKSTGVVMVMKELKTVDKNHEKQFINEIELLKLLHHKNLLKYIGVVLINARMNIILEYIAGGTLRKLIKDQSVVLSPRIKSKIALDISSGMSYLHSLNIAHRDLTSKNCLLRDRQTYDVVVSDFGLSRIIHRVPLFLSKKPIEQLDVVGTPYWIAPEMLNGKQYELSVDIFSYGIVICELLGRTNAHPDNIPRLNNFGLDEKKFRQRIMGIVNPQYLINLAVNCCNIDPEKRSSFSSIMQLIQIKMNEYSKTECSPLISNKFPSPSEST